MSAGRALTKPRAWSGGALDVRRGPALRRGVVAGHKPRSEGSVIRARVCKESIDNEEEEEKRRTSLRGREVLLLH